MKRFLIIVFSALVLFLPFTAFSQQTNKTKKSQNVTSKKKNPAKSKKTKSITKKTTKAKKSNKSEQKAELSYINYKIRKGDTPAKIAKAHHISTETLLNNNKSLNPKNLKLGATIKIPVSKSKNNAKSKTINANRENDFHLTDNLTLYKVKKGDTLYSISKKFNISEDEIKKLNKLNDENLIKGMSLKISNLNKENLEDVPDVDEEDEDLTEEEIKEEGGILLEEKDQPKYTLRSDDLNKMLNTALDYMGTTYKYGGSSASAIDCSAFVKSVFKDVNINLPRTSREQFTLGVKVDRENLKEGDLLFFAKKKRISHVAIYIGNNMYIHAARKGKGVIVSKMDNPYFKKTFVGAKRIFKIEEEKNPDIKKEVIKVESSEKPLNSETP